MIGTTELILVLAVVVLLFGATRIPALADAVGRGVRTFQRGLRGENLPAMREPPADHRDDRRR